MNDRRPSSHTAVALLAAAVCGVAGIAACTAAPPPPGGLTPEQSRFATDVGALDDHLVDPDVAVRLGEEVCSQLDEGVTPEEVALRSQRFTGGEVALDRAEADSVVEAARRHLC